MQKKQIIIQLDGSWVLERRDAEKLPISTFIELISKAFDGLVEVSDESLTECTFFINKPDIDNTLITEKINAVLRDGLSLTETDNAATVTIDDVDISETDEVESAPEEKAKQKTSIGDLLHAADSTPVAETTGKSAAEQISALIGAAEFKKLAKEIVSIAPKIVEHKTFEAFSFQSFLFAINDGCGMSTYLKLFADLIEENGLYKFASPRKVVETKLLPPDNPERKNPFSPVLDLLVGLGKIKGVLFAIDISEWMTHINEKPFKDFLLSLENHSPENIFVFRIPFVEGNVLADIGSSLQDVLFTRTVPFLPMSNTELVEHAKMFLEEIGFAADDSAWKVFNSRVMDEKSDGRFYGLKTIKKIIREMVYLKQLCISESGNDNTVIKDEDILALSKTYSQAAVTAESLLENLVGMDSIKSSIDEIIAHIELSRLNKRLAAPSIHMRFVGNPGTGKTTVARIIGLLLKERGVLRNGNFFERSGRDFCGKYIGETAPKTSDICRSAYGSVLFIDEAYTLFRNTNNDRDYGREALDTLIAEMENHRDDMVVIMAGYTDEMALLMEGNAGLESRMPYVIEFPNYTREQLIAIFFKMVDGSFTFDNDFRTAVCDYFNALSDETISAKDFSNARFVRNLFERTCAKASIRRNFNDDGNLILTSSDFTLASSERVFQSLISKKVKTRIGF